MKTMIPTKNHPTAKRFDHWHNQVSHNHDQIHAVAARWGFTDPAHFTRTFRAVHGITPHNYRKQHHQSHSPQHSIPNRTRALENADDAGAFHSLHQLAHHLFVGNREKTAP